MSETEFVRAGLFESEMAALHAKAVLEDNNIRATIPPPDSGAFGVSLEGEEEIELIVERKDLAAAQALIAEIETPDADPVPEWTCKCGEQVDEGFAVCWSCNAEYPGANGSKQ